MREFYGSIRAMALLVATGMFAWAFWFVVSHEDGVRVRMVLKCRCGAVIYDGPGVYDGHCPAPWPVETVGRCGDPEGHKRWEDTHR